MDLEYSFEKVRFTLFHYFLVLTIPTNNSKDGEYIDAAIDLGRYYYWPGVKDIKFKKMGSDSYLLEFGDDRYVSVKIDVDEPDFASVRVRQSFYKNDPTVSNCIAMTPRYEDRAGYNWYGGPQQANQTYPIQDMILTDFPYVTDGNGSSVMERLWISSKGFFIHVSENTPLFVDQNLNYEETEEIRNQLCFTAKLASPYFTSEDMFTFDYIIGHGTNAKTTYKNLITSRTIFKPLDTPNRNLIRHPVWNTQVRYRNNVDQNIVATFADEIISNGFNRSVMTIDGPWETCYGSMTVNDTKFSDLKSLVLDLEAKGFLVSLSVHPFINFDCEPFYSIATDSNSFVRSYTGNKFVSWWNSKENGASHLDLTRKFANLKSKLDALRATFSIDSFKLDAGEFSYLPKDPFLSENPWQSAHAFTLSYLNLAFTFGGAAQVKTAFRTQSFSMWLRMSEFNSRWSADNGLQSLVPRILQLSLNGYVFLMSDVIGGTRKQDESELTKELFIRWLQASVFLPSLQFSVAPWDFDEETVNISLKFTRLHAEYADLILDRFDMAIANGEPGEKSCDLNHFALAR